MESYVERIKHNAEHLAKDIFPKKALELDEIINSESLSTDSLSKCVENVNFPKPEDFLISRPEISDLSLQKEKESPNDLQTKKRKYDGSFKTDEPNGCKVILFPNGGISTNSAIVDLLKTIKPFIIHFLDSSAALKLWIQILIPQVEDFKAELSLQIQEETLSEIRSIESEVATYLDHIYKYYAVRGKLVKSLAKFPHIADFRQSVIELDEKMFMTVRLVALELRNHYTTVHDILIKNMEKIKKPRNDNNMISMY